MTDSAQEHSSNSKSNLIEFQHVGVTAKLQSPLKNLMPSCSSSTESENHQVHYRGNHMSNTKYNKFLNEPGYGTDTTVTESSKVLYEMKSVSKDVKGKRHSKLTPSKIEFQLYSKPRKRLQKNKQKKSYHRKKPKRQLFDSESPEKSKKFNTKRNASIFQCLKDSFTKLKHSKHEKRPEVDKIFVDLPEPETMYRNAQEIRIGIYPFDRGCADYLKTHDCPPQIMSMILAERATGYATRFWAEFFGSLQIGVSFIVTFLLQSYRFVLYSIINLLLVEFLHMTSDYFVKPLLTVVFNGFLQPPLIFCFNILSSLRDALEPIADIINNFMKPIATIGRSVRLVHVSYNKKNISKRA